MRPYIIGIFLFRRDIMDEKVVLSLCEEIKAKFEGVDT
jgi:hypothetical protein